MFLYVMDVKSRDKLLSLGFKLLKSNDKKTLWVFVNSEKQTFNEIDISCVISDVLTF